MKRKIIPTLTVMMIALLLTGCNVLDMISGSEPAAVEPEVPLEPAEPQIEEPATAVPSPAVELVMPTATQPPATPVPEKLEDIWVTNWVDNSLVMFDMNLTAPQQIILLEGKPRSVAQAAGFVWVVDEENDTLVQVDPAVQDIVNIIPIPGFDLGVMAYGEGALWIGAQEKEELPEGATSSPIGGVIRVDPASGEVIQYISLNGPVSDFAFLNGTPWVIAKSAGFSTLNQIDPTTNIAVSNGDASIWYEETRISANSSGIWLINSTSPEVLHQIDPNTWELVGSVDISKVIGNPLDLAANEEAVWILFDNGTVGRFDLNLMDVTSFIPVSEYAGEIFVNEDGVWALSQSDAKVYRIDTAQNRVVASAITGNALPTPTPTPRPTKSAWEACDSAYLSRLNVGDRAKVSEFPPANNRARVNPNTDSEIVGYISPGEEMVILEGPSCSNNWVWWKVRSASGVEGWTAEGDEDNYWLVPIR